MSSERRHAPATLRNRDALLSVLREVLPTQGLVVEVASGSGEHAVHFAHNLPSIVWQPSDPEEAARRSVLVWSEEAALDNLLPPTAFDACGESWPWPEPAAIVCINMIHIAPPEATTGLLRHAGAQLPEGAPLVLYGPFREGGEHTAPSNAEFDASLKARDPRWGVRDLDAVIAEAAGFGLVHDRTTRMPANNLSVVLRRASRPPRRPG